VSTSKQQQSLLQIVNEEHRITVEALTDALIAEAESEEWQFRYRNAREIAMHIVAKLAGREPPVLFYVPKEKMG
jgi:hypothetical protein